jgi:hypothetical protein
MQAKALALLNCALLAATLLKHELDDDPIWNEFARLASQTKRKVQQTPLAPLSPPNQRTKARYMNVDVLIH